MEKYCFTEDIYDIKSYEPKSIGKKKTIRYKCLICGETRKYDETWTDAKKAEVQAEVDTHHAEHFTLS